MKALATGDLHLGKGATYADDRLGEQEQVWRSILELAVAEECDAVLVAGDIFEGPLPTPEHYEAFARPLRDFPDLPVVACLGNGRHDAALRATSAPAVIAAPNFTLHATPGVTVVGDTWICALPWAPVSRLVAARGGGDRDEVHLDAVEHLLTVARGLRDGAEANHVGPTVLLLHWSISGAALPNGLPVDLAREPVLPVEELEALGFDAIVGGHIHKAQPLGSLAPDDELMPIFYVGSPMPLDFSEAGYDHGCWILDVGGTDYPHVRFVPIPSRPFRQVDADLTWLPVDVDPTEWLAGIVLVGTVAETVLKVRYTVTAGQRRRMDEALVRRVLLDAGAHRLFLEPDVIREERARGVAVDETLDVDAALGLWLAEENVEAGLAERARGRHAAYAAEAAGAAA